MQVATYDMQDEGYEMSDYELQVTSTLDPTCVGCGKTGYETRLLVASRRCELRVTGCEMRVLSYEIQDTRCDAR